MRPGEPADRRPLLVVLHSTGRGVSSGSSAGTGRDAPSATYQGGETGILRGSDHSDRADVDLRLDRLGNKRPGVLAARCAGPRAYFARLARAPADPRRIFAGHDGVRRGCRCIADRGQLYHHFRGCLFSDRVRRRHVRRFSRVRTIEASWELYHAHGMAHRASGRRRRRLVARPALLAAPRPPLMGFLTRHGHRRAGCAVGPPTTPDELARRMGVSHQYGHHARIESLPLMRPGEPADGRPVLAMLHSPRCGVSNDARISAGGRALFRSSRLAADRVGPKRLCHYRHMVRRRHPYHRLRRRDVFPDLFGSRGWYPAPESEPSGSRGGRRGRGRRRLPHPRIRSLATALTAPLSTLRSIAF